MSENPYRAGFVALIGRPNVGKSTLVNALTGQKIAIVSPKPQTTRTRITAILNRPGAQVTLVDTPGLTKGVDALRKAMRRISQTAAADADVALVIVEIERDRVELNAADRDVIAAARRSPGQIVVAINKVDRLKDKSVLLPWMETYAGEAGIDAIVPISAKRSDGLDILLGELISRLPESPPLFPDDMVTEQAERVICAELVREQVLLQTRQEVPHATAVVIEQFEDRRTEEGGACHLQGRIYVERNSQKGIVVGKGGHQIKAIGETARHEMEAVLGCTCHLKLTVHVDKDWRRSERAVQRLGYGPLDVE
jgi:GTP-binding protein Era